MNLNSEDQRNLIDTYWRWRGAPEKVLGHVTRISSGLVTLEFSISDSITRDEMQCLTVIGMWSHENVNFDDVRGEPFFVMHFYSLEALHKDFEQVTQEKSS